MAHLPPQRRSLPGAVLAQHADGSRLVLPRCRECGTVQYPVRERCRHCLADDLAWEAVATDGRLLSWTPLQATVEPFFRDHLPWPVGRVKLACGPVVIVHLAVAEPHSGMEVRVHAVIDRGGAAVLVATGATDTSTLQMRLAALTGRD